MAIRKIGNARIPLETGNLEFKPLKHGICITVRKWLHAHARRLSHPSRPERSFHQLVDFTGVGLGFCGAALECRCAM